MTPDDWYSLCRSSQLLGCIGTVMKLKSVLNSIQEGRITSAQEETFELFSHDFPPQNLGFVDPKPAVLELSVAGLDLTVHQSPSVLASNRAGGTTGAVLWKVTPTFGEWLSSPDNMFFTSGLLSDRSAVIELGCGVSAVIGLLLAPKISRYVLTDQPYVARLVEQNLEENKDLLKDRRKAGGNGRRSKTRGPERRPKVGADTPSLRVGFVPLDWETDEVGPALAGAVPEQRGFDAVVACDCIYNEALIQPLVQTCADVCRLREGGDNDGSLDAVGAEPCVCIVAQQLRDPEIFEGWLVQFMELFDVWRIPDSYLSEGLRSGTGFAVHLGVLKSTRRTESDTARS